MCVQQRLRPACAYAQTDQRLCWSLEYSRSVKLVTEHHLEFLSLKGGCTGSSESTLVKMPHCWKSRVAAQMCLAQKHNTVTPVRLEPAAPLSRVKHSTTEPLCSLCVKQGIITGPTVCSDYFFNLVIHTLMFLAYT